MECLDHSIMNRIGHNGRMTDKSLPNCLMHHIQYSVLTLRLSQGLESREIKLFDYLASPGCAERHEAFFFIGLCGLRELHLLIILQLVLVHRDVVILANAEFGHDEIFLVTLGVPKEVLT